MTLLSVEDLDVAYGDLQVLWNVSLAIEDDQDIVALVGPNGTGKTTLLKTISGLVEPEAGRIELFGEEIADRSGGDVDGPSGGRTGLREHLADGPAGLRERLADGPAELRKRLAEGPAVLREPLAGSHRGYAPEDVVDLGFVHITEGRNLFDEMTVHDNLQMGAYRNREDFEQRREEVYDLFPVLEERSNQQAGTLSGGEQQMLAIGRGLIADPDLLALDEPSGALAPQLAERVFETIERISEDVTVLLVEQHVDRALGLADYAYLLENGRVTQSGTGDALLASDHVREAYLSG